MPIEVLMPALSPTMTEGNLAKWLVKEGDKVKPGDVIAEIETDKATMEVEAVDEGVVGKIMIPAGTSDVKVNALIALLLEDGEEKGALANFAANQGKAETKAPDATAAAPAASAAKAEANVPAANVQSGDRVFASPLAKRIAEQEGVDLKAVSGTGPHGRIIKADVEEAKGSAGAKAPAATASAPVALTAGRNPQETIEIPLNNMRKTIAKRLQESKQQVPHFYLSMDIELDNLLALRKQLNDAAEAGLKEGEKPAYKLSVNDLVVKAVAMAMRAVPASNASFAGDKILQFTNVDVSVAVAIDGGLITPIVRNADLKSVSTVSNELKDLIKRARDGKLKPEEFQGGGFSVSNLGMYGVKTFSAIINPPQACILAVGAGEERVVVRGGHFKAVNMMTVTLSVDHRVVDGAVGSDFLNAFKRYIEQPMGMLV